MTQVRAASRALQARSGLGALWDWQLALALGLFAVLLTLAAQRPLTYRIEIGQEDGLGADLPLLRGFYPPEHDVHGSFRWTSERSMVRLPGIGQRPVGVSLRVFPISDEVVQRGPHELEVWSGGQLVARLPVRKAGADYRFLVPPPPDSSGDHELEIRSTTFIPSGDQRAIGSPVDSLTATAAGLTIPPWRHMLGWLLAAALFWQALAASGFGPRAALVMLLPAILLVSLAAALDPPRAALGVRPALITLLLGWLLVVTLRLAASLFAMRLNLPLGQRALRWLLLLAFLVFGLRYGGKLYPDSMPGDIGFHANRYADVISGMVLLLSRNRGVDFPYPPAFYLILAPFSLLGPAPRTLLRLGGALLDAISPFLIYAIATAGQPANNQQQASDTGAARVGILAAAIYTLSAAGFMTTWWNFSTHIFTQFAHLLLITALVLYWRQPHRSAQAAKRSLVLIAVFVLLQYLVYLGHFGFWINTSLLGGMGLALLVIWGPRYWRAAQPLLISFFLAELASVLLFYSAYAGLFLDQARATASGGLTGLAGREPVSLAILWATLWNAGLRIHFGFFPIPLAFAGLVLLWLRRRQVAYAGPCPSPLPILPLLISATFLIGLGFAVLPFLSGSTLSTRWLMFSAWAIALTAAFSARRLWETGRASRLLLLLMGTYILWITLSQWVAALAWRIRPPEPF